MENRAHALAAGLFALMLGAAAAVAIWWFSESREPMREYELVSRGNITGLNVQAQVRYRGMTSGKVTGIGIDPVDPRNLLVTISLREDLPVTQGTKATLGYQGVTGLAFVQLDDRGDKPEPLTGEGGRPPRLTLQPGLMDQIGDATVEALQRVRDIADKVAAYFDDDSVDRLSSTVKHLESAAVGLDRTFAVAPDTLATIGDFFSADNAARLSATLGNLERLSGEATPAVEELRGLIGRVDKLAGSVDTAVNSLDSNVSATVSNVAEGTLPQVESLLEELADTSSKLGRLIEEIEASPQMLVTGRSAPRPGPGEAGFSGTQP